MGTTNFDTPHVAEILKAGIPLVSQQLQYSVLDQRPANSLTTLAAANDVKFLCYGSVAGGFLSDKWLGQPEPEMPLENRSLVKYKLIIDDFGGWDLFQSLLSTLKVIGDRHGVDIATVASAWVLRQPQVAAVIVGARNQAHALANAGIMDVVLSAGDIAQIEAIIAESKGPSVTSTRWSATETAGMAPSCTTISTRGKYEPGSVTLRVCPRRGHRLPRILRRLVRCGDG